MVLKDFLFSSGMVFTITQEDLGRELKCGSLVIHPFGYYNPVHLLMVRFVCCVKSSIIDYDGVSKLTNMPFGLLHYFACSQEFF